MEELRARKVGLVSLRDGALDFPDDLLAELDVVVASLHQSFNQTESEITQRLISAARNPYVHMLGHLTGRLLLEREAYKVDLAIMNVENAAGGFGVTPQIADELFDLGADVMTTGNHVWDKRELLDYLGSVISGIRLVYPPGACQ